MRFLNDIFFNFRIIIAKNKVYDLPYYLMQVLI